MLNSPFLNAVGSGCAKFALSLGLPVEGLIKATIFEQFCGGETIGECERAINKLGDSHIGTILDYSVEGKATEEDFDRTKDEIIRTIDRAKDDPNIPFAVFKVTGIAPLGTLERLSAKKKLDAKSQAKCERIHNRVNEICEFAYSVGQPVFIDAEDSWIQDAIDRLKLVVPLALVLIALLLYVNFSSVTDMLLALSVIPMALIGGIVALFVTGTPFSVFTSRRTCRSTEMNAPSAPLTKASIPARGTAKPSPSTS